MRSSLWSSYCWSLEVVLLAMYSKTTSKTLSEITWKTLMHKYLTNNNTKNLFDKMQQELECCGTNNYTDWEGILPAGDVPDSCCKTDTQGCGTGFKDKDIYTEGCVDKLNSILADNIILIAGIAIAVAVIQIFGVVCSCCLMRSIKSEYEVV